MLNATGHSLRWEVRWVVPHKGDYRIICKEFEQDLTEAIKLYTRAQAAGKRFATLRCSNSGFPPPEKWQDPQQMGRANKKGIFWCPYCREMRKFQKQAAFMVGDIAVPEAGIHCPICGASHRDFYVRRWNPVGKRMYEGPKARRRSRATPSSNGKGSRSNTAKRRQW